MSDIRYESELVKSLHRLDEILNKSQIEHGDGNQPKSWEGGDVTEYDSDTDAKWKDDIEDNGTDYDRRGKSKKKMSKGGYGSEEADEEYEEEADEEKDDDEKDVEKSVRTGVEVSEFLGELTKSIAIYCNDLEDAVIKSISDLHNENGEVVKSLAYNLSVLSDTINGSKDNLVKYAEGPARGPKSFQHMSKSVPSEDTLNKDQVIGMLVKGVEAGLVSPLEVIKCEQYGPGAVSQNVLKSLTA